MAITAALAIQFSNQQVRTFADLEMQAYKRASTAAARWTSLGGGQTALNLMQKQIQDACNYILAAFDAGYWVEKVWNNGVSALFPNDTTQVWDNFNNTAQDPTRPPLTGAAETNVVTRAEEFQNWLQSATESFTDSARNNLGALNTVIQCSNYGPATIVLADAGNAINRFNELTTNLQANTNANLGTLLQAAVNPNS